MCNWYNLTPISFNCVQFLQTIWYYACQQIWPWSTKWSRERQIEFCQENTLVIANTLLQKHKRRLYTWTSTDSQQQNKTDYILCSQRWRSSIQSTKTGPGTDCGSDHEYLIAKFRLKLKKVGNSGMTYIKSPTITVEVTNKFNWLDLIDRVPDEL